MAAVNSKKARTVARSGFSLVLRMKNHCFQGTARLVTWLKRRLYLPIQGTFQLACATRGVVSSQIRGRRLV